MSFADDAEWRRLDRKVTAASEARFRLPVGASRSRVTTANARWATACEARDRREHELLKEAASGVPGQWIFRLTIAKGRAQPVRRQVAVHINEP